MFSLGGNMAINVLNKIKLKLCEDIFFSASLLAVIITSFFNIPRIDYIDFKVIACLFELMIIIKVFEEYSLLSYISVAILNSCKNQRILTQVLCLISFVFSMLLTNDVSLLTVLPIMVLISQKSDFNIIIPSVMVTISANLGSSATPMGNPQNLYIFSFFKLNAKSFFNFSLPICIISLILIILISFIIKPRQINCDMGCIKVVEKKKIGIFSILFVLIILSVFGMVHYLASLFVVVLITSIFNKSTFKKVDYKLLITFICFFIAVGNVSNISIFKSNLSNITQTMGASYIVSIILSQVISNVPSTILLAPFTKYSYALFCGANIGGLGTPIASLASLISYKIFVNEYPQEKKEYLIKFTILNFFFLVVLGTFFYSRM
ncbi:anion permease [Clostridium autoethanogenum]|uniref:Anion permease n=2 Tax=Clostridium autoethanogenum TaxID=84023 RepID=A0A3M0T802_9CLOT|nr:anion permease [Clostridium autoethanogenum]